MSNISAFDKMRVMNHAFPNSSLQSTQKAFRLFLVASVSLHLAALFYQKSSRVFVPAMNTVKMEQSLKIRLQERKQEVLKPQAKPQKKLLKKKITKKKTLKKVAPKKKQEVLKQAAPPPRQRSMAFESAIKNYVHPHFPRLAIRRGITGTVKINLVVKGSGQVQEVLLAQSSGHPMLDNSALEAARRWVFKELSADQKGLYNISKTLVFKIN